MNETTILVWINIAIVGIIAIIIVKLYFRKDELEKDEYILEVLGEHISRNYIAAKRTEWAEYTSQVTDWEIEQYLYKI